MHKRGKIRENKEVQSPKKLQDRRDRLHADAEEIEKKSPHANLEKGTWTFLKKIFTTLKIPIEISTVQNEKLFKYVRETSPCPIHLRPWLPPGRVTPQLHLLPLLNLGGVRGGLELLLQIWNIKENNMS